MTAGDSYLRELSSRGYREEDEARFLASWERFEAAYFARMFAVTAPYDGWREQFRAAATETMRLVEAHRPEASFLVVDAIAAGELGRERQRAFAARIVELLDGARQELEDPESIPEATAGWIAAIFFDRVYRRLAGGRDPDLPSQLPELMFLAVSAYYGTGAGLDELIPSP